MVKLLKTLSSKATVIAGLHQPQFKIFDLFDNLILMRKGDIVYQGAAGKSVVGYFDSLGFPCPQFTNPADHILDVLTGAELLHSADSAKGGDDCALFGFGADAGSSNNNMKQPTSRDDLLSAEMVAVEKAERHTYSLRSASAPSLPEFVVDVDLKTGSDQPELKKHTFLPWPRQFYILFLRSLHLHIRRYDIILMNVFVTMLVSTFVSMSTWRSLGNFNSSMSRRQPALFYCVIHQGIISSLQGTHSFPLDRALMLRERSAGTYSVSAYFTAKSAADFLTQVISPIIFTCMVYPIVGFDTGARKFFIFMGFMILTSQAATSLSNLISCVCVSIELSTVVLACCYEISRLYGGWFIKPADMAVYQEWRFADALSYIKYAFVGVSLNENDGLIVTCVGSTKTCSAPCTTLNQACSGASINTFYGYADYTMHYCAGILLVYIFGCKIFSYLALRFIKM